VFYFLYTQKQHPGNTICHPTLAALIISRQRWRSIYPDRGSADRERTNEQTKTMIDIEKSDQNSQQRFLWSRAGGRDWLQRRAEIARVSVKRDTGRPWAAATAAWLVIHGVAAGMRHELQRRLWDVRYTGRGRLEQRVERWAAQRRNVSPDWLINYPMQAVHPV